MWDDGRRRSGKYRKIKYCAETLALFSLGPSIVIQNPSVDFGLISIGDDCSRQISLYNSSHLPAKWKIRQMDKDAQPFDDNVDDDHEGCSIKSRISGAHRSASSGDGGFTNSSPHPAKKSRVGKSAEEDRVASVGSLNSNASSSSSSSSVVSGPAYDFFFEPGKLII